MLDFTHAPLPQYAQAAAAYALTPLAFKCRKRKRGRFLCRTTIALTRRRTWASMTPNPWTASGVHSRKCDIQPVRYRLTPSMQEVSDRPQFGGVISRILVLSRRTALPEGNTATSSPSSPRAQRKPQAQELNLVGSANATLLLVDLEPHARLQKSPNRCHDAPPGALAAHEDVAIIGVANEPQAPPRQFAVQFVEHDVGKQWRERTPLRRSFLDYDLRPVRHDHRRLQHQADQGEYPRVRHAFREPGQQALMVNSVEEFGQVQINNRSIAVLEISRCFGDGGMSAALGAEPV